MFNIVKLNKIFIFENKNFIVINKPISLPVHKGSKNIYNLLDIVKNLSKYKLNLLHRIDIDTTGCILFSKSLNFLKIGNKLFLKKKIIKEYLLCVYGVTKKHFKIKTKLKFLNKYNNKLKKKDLIVTTECKTLFNFKKFSFVKVFLNSGKLHQIRIHLSSIGHPLINDSRYGNLFLNKYLSHIGINKIFLHAYKLTFVYSFMNYKYLFLVNCKKKILHILFVLNKFNYFNFSLLNFDRF